jgi:hypothetical protein
MITTLTLVAFLWTMPPSLEPRREEVELVMAESIGLFRDECAKYYPIRRCTQAVNRAKIKILDTKLFQCGQVLNARGCYAGIRNIRVAYNHDDVDQIILHELCHFFGLKVGHVAGKEQCEPVGG